jgi:hypothetical protein
MRFTFAFDQTYRVASLPFGITPATAWVDVEDERLSARFGLWRVTTDLANITGTQFSGPYGLLRTLGPARMSLADRGLTFATNGRRGLCMRFRAPVSGLDPTGHLRHPGLTVTVADVDGLAAALGVPPVT